MLLLTLLLLQWLAYLDLPHCPAAVIGLGLFPLFWLAHGATTRLQHFQHFYRYATNLLSDPVAPQMPIRGAKFSQEDTSSQEPFGTASQPRSTPRSLPDQQSVLDLLVTG